MSAAMQTPCIPVLWLAPPAVWQYGTSFTAHTTLPFVCLFACLYNPIQLPALNTTPTFAAHTPRHECFFQLFKWELGYVAAADAALLQKVLLEQHGNLAAIQQRQPHASHETLHARVL